MSYLECVGCGYCCLNAPCRLFEKLPCPSLEFKDGRYLCKEADTRRDELKIGKGCLFPERRLGDDN